MGTGTALLTPSQAFDAKGSSGKSLTKVLSPWYLGLTGLSVKGLRQVWGRVLVAGMNPDATPPQVPGSSPNGHDGPQDRLQQGQEIEADG